jgi:uncharacterized protein YdeI (YjbR/CyaY-like superfamily)
MNTSNVDSYLQDGCGRCDDYRTPACKVHRWADCLVALREQLARSGLVETMKWGCPCYTLDGKNVAMIAAFRESCALSFFRGAALPDPDGLLESAGPNSHHARLVRFTTLEQVTTRAEALGRLLAAAVAHERSGVKPTRAPAQDPVPEELQRRLDTDEALRAAFGALTPGRQRSHVLHVSGAKQTETRARRVERCAEDILAGRGFNER